MGSQSMILNSRTAGELLVLFSNLLRSFRVFGMNDCRPTKGIFFVEIFYYV